MSAGNGDKEKMTPLPALKRALERRYPGVAVEICLHHDLNGEDYTVKFSSQADVLIGYGLARRHPRFPAALVAAGAPEVKGQGADWGNRSFVVHYSSDDEPVMPGSRTWPPKWVVTEYERLMRRVRKSKRTPATP